VRKPVHATRAPQVSRRGLWRRLAGAKQPAAVPLEDTEEPRGDGKQLPRERQALLDGLARLPGEKRAPGAAFPALRVAATCTACQVCATVCPTGALALTADGETFALQYAPLACTECGLCTPLCAPQALEAAGRIRYDDAHPVVLHAGHLRLCRRCRAAFAGAGDLCPTCDFRRRNPAGMRPRPKGG
jgi:ferredoxin